MLTVSDYIMAYAHTAVKMFGTDHFQGDHAKIFISCMSEKVERDGQMVRRNTNYHFLIHPAIKKNYSAISHCMLKMMRDVREERARDGHSAVKKLLARSDGGPNDFLCRQAMGDRSMEAHELDIVIQTGIDQAHHGKGIYPSFNL